MPDRELACQYCGTTFIGWHKRKYCSLKCAVDSRILIRGEDDCWPWHGGTFLKDGYGRVKFLEVDDHAHRIAYKEHVGSIPEGLVIRHSCDNPICCNYKRHLLLGTVKDNSQDAVARHRVAHGSRQHSSKLTPDKVIQIRSLYSEGYTFRELGARFDCSDASIIKLLSGKTWNRVPGSVSLREQFWSQKGRRVLTPSQVETIQSMSFELISQQDVADVLGCAQSVISRASRGIL